MLVMIEPSDAFGYLALYYLVPDACRSSSLDSRSAAP